MNRNIYSCLLLFLFFVFNMHIHGQPLVGWEKPGPCNTGPYDESILVPSGTISVNTDGAIIENVDVTGMINVYANNVTIRNFRISSNDYFAIRCWNGVTGLVIEDGEILNINAEAIAPSSNFTARRIEVHESSADAFKAGDNTTIESCWMHHLGNSEGAHADAIQVLEGTNIFIQGNFIDAPDPLPTGYSFNAALMASTGYGPIDNLVFDNNWADGGSFTIQIRNGGNGDATNLSVSNNHFGGNYVYGIHAFDFPVTYTGNLEDPLDISTFPACGEESGSSTISVTGVTLSPSSSSLNVGQTLDLTETVSPSNASDKSVTWSSSNTAVATVDGNGVVTAQSSGQAIITTATNDGGFSATCVVTVNNSTPPANAGTITRDYWTGLVYGTAVSDLTSLASYPDSPTGSDEITSLQAVSWNDPSITANWDNNYGQRIYGFIQPPTSGDYIFWISSDDASDLYLSTDNDPDNKIRIAYVSGYSNALVWDKYPEQKSVPISLSAGQKYFIEVLHREGGGGDHLAVGWSKPGEGTSTPSEIVPGNVLSPFSELSTIEEYFDIDASSFAVQAGGNWAVSNGRYVLSSPANGGVGLLGNISVHNTIVSGDFNLSTLLNITGTSGLWDDAAVVFNYQDINNYYYVALNERNDANTCGILKVENGIATELCDITATITSDTDYLLEISKTGNDILVKLDGTQVASATDATFTNGKVGYGSKNDAAQFDDLIVSTDISGASVTGVSLSSSSQTLDIGQTHDLDETVLPANATDKSVSWTTNNVSVATVDANGVVSALSGGQATITATTNDGGFTASCSITVSSPTRTESINSSTDDIQIYADGGTAWVGDPTIRVGGATSVDGCAVYPFQLPVLAANESVLNADLSISLNTIANSPSGNIDMYGLPYRTTSPVNSTADYWQGAYGTDPNGTAIQDDFATINTPVGYIITSSQASVNLAAYINAQYAAGAAGGEYIFIRLNPDLADVSSYFFWQFYTANSSEPPILNLEISTGTSVVDVTGVSVSPTSLTLNQGQTSDLAETVVPANATDKSVTWSSGNTAVATVDANGVVTAVSVGNTTITVTTNDGGYTATCNVTVNSGTTLTSYYCDPVSGSMSNNGSQSSPWSTLEAVFAAGKTFSDGDIIYLMSGDHGAPVISEANTAQVTITKYASDTPVLTSLKFNGASNWLVKDIKINPEAPFPNQNVPLAHPVFPLFENSLFQVLSSSDITIENCMAISYENSSSWTTDDWNSKAWNGIYINAGTDITITNCHFKNVNFGLEAVYSTNVILEYSLIEDFCGDGVRPDCDYATIQYNTIQNARMTNGNHCDLIQVYTGADVTGTVIRGNKFINYTDPAIPFVSSSQGIALFDGMYIDFVIENNLIVTDHWHGLAIYGATNCKVINNTVVDPNNASPGPSWIAIQNGPSASSGNIVRNNISNTQNIVAGSCVQDHNLTVAYANYSTWFNDYTNFDFSLKSGCTAIDAGSSTDAPAIDIDENPRPQGSGFDVGCYEYGGTMPATGTINRDYWTGISGQAVSDLTTYTGYPDAPTGRDELSSFQAVSWIDPSQVDNWDNTYGQRVYGYVHPPVSGDYIFWISGDDDCDLYLSTDDDLSNKTRIAYVDGWTISLEWNKYTTQKSASISLVAGQKYFIEAIHKEDGGGDNLAVGWAKPGETTSAPSEVIPGSMLSIYSIVPDVAVTGISVSPAYLSIIIGQNSNLTASIQPTTATDKTLTWSSNNTAVATVDANGVVSALSGGQASITATTNDGGYTSSCQVTVLQSTGLQLMNLDAPTSPKFTLTEIVWPANIGEADVCLWHDDKLSAATMTIDDNLEMQHYWWLSMQDQYPGLVFTWFVISDLVNNWSSFQNVIDEGNDVQAHDMVLDGAHCDINNATDAVYHDVFVNVQNDINQNLTNNSCVTIGYPCGANRSDAVRDLFISGRGTPALINKANQTDYLYIYSRSGANDVNDINCLLDSSATLWGQSYYRGWLSYHYHYLNDFTPTEAFLATLHSHQDKIWIGRYSDVAKYGQERDTHVLTVTEVNANDIKFTLTDDMHDGVFDFPLTVKVRIPNNWSGAYALQNGSPINVNVVTHNGNQYALVYAVPDRGLVEIGDTGKSSAKANYTSALQEINVTVPSMNIWPNPAPENNEICIDLYNFGARGPVNIAVYDITGKSVFSMNDYVPNQETNTIKRIRLNATLKKGVYIVVANTGDRIQKSKFVIK